MMYLCILIFGAIIGSFLNVCIYRMPRGEKVVFSRSKCPSCKKLIPWYDNIPLLSYIFLKGRCRSCGQRISFRYFAVEGIAALASLILFIYFGFSELFWIYSLLSFSLIVISFIDLEFQIIPDSITIGGIILGMILSGAIPGLQYAFIWKDAVVRSLIGVLVGGGVIYFIGVLGNLIFKKESMGGGDVKLMAMLGAFLGWKMALLVFFLAPFFGAPVGLYLKIRHKKDIIPYGPYISLAGFIVIVWGRDILARLLF